jgi:alpha-galactosidase/6-phospho-beta-glucosidase family protein
VIIDKMQSYIKKEKEVKEIMSFDIEGEQLKAIKQFVIDLVKSSALHDVKRSKSMDHDQHLQEVIQL